MSDFRNMETFLFLENFVICGCDFTCCGELCLSFLEKWPCEYGEKDIGERIKVGAH